MQRIIITFFSIILGISSVYAYDLVLPKEKKSVVTNDYAFFVGRANRTEAITVNDEKIYVAPNGAFAFSIKLKEGENRVLIVSRICLQELTL